MKDCDISRAVELSQAAKQIEMRTGKWIQLLPLFLVVACTVIALCAEQMRFLSFLTWHYMLCCIVFLLVYVVFMI